MNIYFIKNNIKEPSYEFVERKGKGHPDTLSDNLAEYLSAKYSRYTMKKFGVILHHNFDKVGLLGGSSYVKFGSGKIVKPIRVLINGRASCSFGKHKIDLRKKLIDWSRDFIIDQLPIKNPKKELEFYYNISTQSSPGKTEEDKNKKNSSRKYWFEPRGLHDIPELKKLVSNDTSMGVGFYPFTNLEELVLRIEKDLNSDWFKEKNKWIGSDIKIMGFRYNEEYKITMCIPQIASKVKSVEGYKKNLNYCKTFIKKIVEKFNIANFELNINTRDNYKNGEFYLTAIGSSIESGDEGLVGRGNRIQGIISPTRLMSMEGAAGKNPVYHIGKIYYLAAQRISEKIYKTLSVKNQIFLVSQSGRDLKDPWIVFVHISNGASKEAKIKKIIEDELNNVSSLTDDIINLKINIC